MSNMPRSRPTSRRKSRKVSGKRRSSRHRRVIKRSSGRKKTSRRYRSATALSVAAAGAVAHSESTASAHYAGGLTILFEFQDAHDNTYVLCDGDLAFKHTVTGFYEPFPFPASMMSMLENCFRGTDCRSGTFVTQDDGSQLNCNALHSGFEFKKPGDTVVIPSIERLRETGVDTMVFHFDDASIRYSESTVLYITEEMVLEIVGLLQQVKGLHKCQVEKIRDFLFTRAQLVAQPDSLCALMEAHYCYSTFIFNKDSIMIAIDNHIVGPFVDQYASKSINTVITDEERVMIKYMMTVYYTEWMKMREEIGRAEGEKVKKDLYEEKAKNYFKATVTATKAGVIGFEIGLGILKGELLHVLGAASALKVSEGVGLHLALTSIPLAGVGVGMVVAGGLSCFGIFMLGRTIKREMEHLRLNDERGDTIRYLRDNPTTVMVRQGNALKIDIQTQNRIFCKDYNIPGCIAKHGSFTEGCANYLRGWGEGWSGIMINGEKYINCT
jgi:hypothetical protein